MMKKIPLILLLMFVSVLGVSAQSRTINGIVISQDEKAPLVGANVSVKGNPTQGAVTNMDGEFTLVASNEDVLVISYVGYITKEVVVGTKSIINVELAPDVNLLEDVVVIGYGTQSTRDITGSVGSVSGEDIERMPVASLDGALQGRAAGVFVSSPSGTPGAGISMQIRGNTSLSASSQPLYVIDGIPIISEDLSGLFSGGQATNTLADINQSDIESIEVLKDASATAIYGSRGANGVVLITTKRGRAGKTKIEVNGYQGFQSVTNTIDMMSSQEYLALMNDAALQDDRDLGTNYGPNYVSDIWGFDPNDPDLQNTDWYDAIFDVAPIQNYDISASGGDAATRFYTSMSYFNQDGVQIGTGFERLSGRINIDSKVNDWLEVGSSVAVSRTVQDRTINDNSLYGVVINTLAGDPLMPVREADGSYADPFNYFGWWMLDNPVLIGEEYFRFTRTTRGLGTVFGEASLRKDLTFKSSLSIDFNYLEDEAYTPIISRESSNANANGFGVFGTTVDYTWLAENFLTYSPDLGDNHSFSAVLGTSFQASNRNFSSINAQGFPNDDFTKLTVAAEVTGASTSGTEWGLASYFFRGNYGLFDRYLFTVTGRADGSSRFGSDQRFGFFPSGSFAWRMSDEAFLRDVDQLSELKLRVSYGITGNQDGIGNFASRGLFGVGDYRQTPTLVPTQLANPGLTWESTRQFNVGIDLGLFNDRVSIVSDYFVKTTDDLLLNRLIPGITGFTSITENIGKVENRGWELAVKGFILQGEFNWISSFNISQVRNKVLELEVDNQILNDSHILAEGQPIGTFFLIDQEGVDPQTGNIIWKDLNNDGAINSADRQIVGNNQPDFFGGWDNSFTYKGFNLDVFFQFTLGNEIFNHSRASYENLGFSRLNPAGFPLPDGNNHTLAEDRWMEPGDNASIPRASLSNVNWREYSSRWLEDGSFIRLRNITLGYTFPRSVVQRLGMQGLKVYMQGQNLLTFTNYTGLDPEVNQNARNPQVAGSDFGTHPQTRSVSFGFKLNL